MTTQPNLSQQQTDDQSLINGLKKHEQIGKAMGINTWAAFAGTDDNAVVDGDFAMAEGELQSVLKTLRGGGINVVALHSHMTNESPRLLFLHYWGRGKAADLAATVKRALDVTAWDGRTQT